MKKVDPVYRLFSNCTIDEDGCWIWNMSKSKYGYGKIKAYGKVMGTHRLSYEVTFGEIPVGYDVNHKCHSDVAVECGGGVCKHRACVNPSHLEIITHAEHGGISVHAQKDTCVRGHVLDYTYPGDSGTRRGCRTCNAVAARAYMARKKLSKP